MGTHNQAALANIHVFSMVSRWYRRDEGRVVGPKKKDILWHTKGKYEPQFIRILYCYLLTTWRQMRFSFSSFSMNNEFFGGAQCAVVWMSFQLCSPWFLQNDKFSNKLDRSVLLRKKSRDIFISAHLFFLVVSPFVPRRSLLGLCALLLRASVCGFHITLLRFYSSSMNNSVFFCFCTRHNSCDDDDPVWEWVRRDTEPSWKILENFFFCVLSPTYFPTL